MCNSCSLLAECVRMCHALLTGQCGEKGLWWSLGRHLPQPAQASELRHDVCSDTTMEVMRNDCLHAYRLEKSNAAQMPLKVVHEPQQDWGCVLPALQVGNIDARSVFSLQCSSGL